MNVMTIKLPPLLDEAVQAAAQKQRIAKSELVRRALIVYLRDVPEGRPFVSAYDLAPDLAGCLDGGPGDLATNPVHMEGFGE